MAPKRRKNYKPITVGEISAETESFIREELANFWDSTDTERSFPTWLTNGDRAWVHDSARKLGLTTKSIGTKDNRYVTIYKTASPYCVQTAKAIPPDIKVFGDLNSKLAALAILDLKESSKSTASNEGTKVGLESGLANQKAQIPPQCRRAENLWMDHPIHDFKFGILESICQHSVTIITGETGCGKTTQVPQYLLEDAAEKKQKMKIICSLPRRVATISVAERVASERRENVGATVGYQIRHESRVSNKTCLTFCTTGVVLRALLSGHALLKTSTHIIIDEIHERDSLSDFTLIALRERLPAHPHLRIILMSATLDVEKLVNYFEEKTYFQGKVGVLAVPGALHYVQITHLETILTKFEADEKAKKTLNNNDDFIPEEDLPYDAEYFEFVDNFLERTMTDGHPQIFDQLQQMIFGGHIPVNYQTRDRKMTPLMVAASHGQLNLVQLLFGLGATDKGIKDKYNNNASFYAERSNHPETIEFFKEQRLASGRAQFVKPITEEDIVNARGDNPDEDEPRMSQHEKDLVEAYMQTQHRGRHIESQYIDYDFIVKILENLQKFYSEEGAILIFLPGYEEIMTMKRLIENHEQELSGDKTIIVYTLHSRMKTGDQKQVFQPTPAGKRKVILATNIAETSITINDVSIVIDTGKVKERTYDILSGALILGTNWISKACARQRAGRAGRTRPGICLRLYTSEQHVHFMEFHIPEMLRRPLQELCLQTKLLAPTDTSIADFLSKALDPPQVLAVEKSLAALKMTDALDCDENLTDLGKRLVNLPVLPHLGKMLVTAIFLKCLQPVLTIVSCLSAGDIFKLPSQPALMMKAVEARMELVDNAMSDHFLLLRIFEEFVAAERRRKERAFCDKLCLSISNMQQVVKIRNQILSSLQELCVTVSTDQNTVNENSKCWPLIKAALTAGLYPNIARANGKNNSLNTVKEPKVNIHPSGSFKKLETPDGKALPPWVVFEELHRANYSLFGSIRTCTVVTPVTVFLFAGQVELPEDCMQLVSIALNKEKQDVKVNIDHYLSFNMKQTSAQYLLQVRQCWGTVFANKLRNPKDKRAQDDLEKVLSIVKQLVVSEEDRLLMKQPSYFIHSQANKDSYSEYKSQGNYYQRNSSGRDRDRYQQEAGSWRRQNENLHQQQSYTGWGSNRNSRNWQEPMRASTPAHQTHFPKNYRQGQGSERPNPHWGNRSQYQQQARFSDFELKDWREERHLLHRGKQPLEPNTSRQRPATAQGVRSYGRSKDKDQEASYNSESPQERLLRSLYWREERSGPDKPASSKLSNYEKWK